LGSAGALSSLPEKALPALPRPHQLCRPNHWAVRLRAGKPKKPGPRPAFPGIFFPFGRKARKKPIFAKKTAVPVGPPCETSRARGGDPPGRPNPRPPLGAAGPPRAGFCGVGGVHHFAPPPPRPPRDPSGPVLAGGRLGPPPKTPLGFVREAKPAAAPPPPGLPRKKPNRPPPPPPGPRPGRPSRGPAATAPRVPQPRFPLRPSPSGLLPRRPAGLRLEPPAKTVRRPGCLPGCRGFRK